MSNLKLPSGGNCPGGRVRLGFFSRRELSGRELSGWELSLLRSCPGELSGGTVPGGIFHGGFHLEPVDMQGMRAGGRGLIVKKILLLWRNILLYRIYF